MLGRFARTDLLGQHIALCAIAADQDVHVTIAEETGRFDQLIEPLLHAEVAGIHGEEFVARQIIPATELTALHAPARSRPAKSRWENKPASPLVPLCDETSPACRV